VLYFGSAPLAMRGWIANESLQYRYMLLDIRDNKFFQEAYAVGIEDGIEKGEAAFLTRMLERRFGPLPEWAREKIEKMSKSALEEAGLRLLEAEKLEEVFPPDLSN
jgi:hypothetical protein